MTEQPGLGTTRDSGSSDASFREQPKQAMQGQLLAFHPMASQGNDVPMHSTLGRLGMSWQEYRIAKIHPQMEWGLRAFCFHLPHGKPDPPGPMAFDAYLMARKRKMPWAKGFTKAVKPLVKDGIRVIVYMGSLRETPRMAELREKPYGDDGWIDTFAHSIRPYVNAGCEIAFDAAAHWPVDGPEHCFVRGLRNLGTPVHIEGPEYDGAGTGDFDGHLRDLPLIMNHQQLHGNTIPKPKWRDDPTLYPKITTLLDGHSKPSDASGSADADKWAPPLVRKDLAAGYDCCLFMYDKILEMGMERLIGGGG